MYQTHASMAKDIGAVGSMRSPVMLFCRMGGLDAVIERLDGAEIGVPRRRTRYGADEIYVRTVGADTLSASPRFLPRMTSDAAANSHRGE
jgi:hypothetical protein